MAKAERADRLLDRPGVTNLLRAQAAEMDGDRKTAEAAYKALIARDDDPLRRRSAASCGKSSRTATAKPR